MKGLFRRGGRPNHSSQFQKRIGWILLLGLATLVFVVSSPASAGSIQSSKNAAPFTFIPPFLNTPTDTPIFSFPTPTDTPFFFPTNTRLPTATRRPTATPTPTRTPLGIQPSYTIPAIKRVVTLDGVCDGSREYRDAIVAGFVDGNGVTGVVYLKHDDTYLYICMVGAVGSDPQRFAAVYLDPDLGREDVPHSDELSLRIGFTAPTQITLQGGNAAGSFVDTTMNGWKAVTRVGSTDQAEFQVPLSLTGCSGTFGLAVYHHWFATISNDYGWPFSQYWDVPKTWATVQLDTPGLDNCSYYLPVVSAQ